MADEKEKNRSREGLTWHKVARFVSLPFAPERMKPYLAFRRLEDVPPERLLADGIEGVLLDADGTLGPHHAREFPEAVVRHVSRMRRAGLRVAIYSNAFTNRFSQFADVAVVEGSIAKPDPQGFLQAMTASLNLDDPRKVCMVGDNFVTDGGAIDAGMRFIHIEPCLGDEPWLLRLTRRMAYLCARRYWPEVFAEKSAS